ncbi:MAG: hypothetical protein KAJ44_00455 [Thermoplasmatales archaeon]|nr:hypothetical protein [Thermoplasmatales archaeon]
MSIEVLPQEGQEPIREHIEVVLNKLPTPIKEGICKNCLIILTGTEHGQHLGRTDKDIIILDWYAMKVEQLHWKQIRHIIAHEFAHYILEQKHMDLTRAEQEVLGVDHEKQVDDLVADDLALRWGFPNVKIELKTSPQIRGISGRLQRKIIDYIEERREAFREEISKALADPNKKYPSERSKIQESIRSLVDDKVLLEGRTNKNLLGMLDSEYPAKYPKPKPIRINKKHPRYKQYCIWKKYRF